MEPREPIAIVGAGAIARALGRLLYLRGEPLVALGGRTQSRAEQAAAFIGPSVQVVTVSDVPRLARRVLVAVSDEAITQVAETLAAGGMTTGAVLHTCGAKGPEALDPLRVVGVACGMLHPLQTVADPDQGVERLQHITFGLAGDRPAVDWAEEIVALLEGNALYLAAERLSWYHAGAVLANNGLVAAMDAAAFLLERSGVERQAALHALEPLARASMDNVFNKGPLAALTGPIVRGDVGTVAAHLEALAAAPPAIATLYRSIAQHLLQLAHQRGVTGPAIHAFESILEHPRGG